VNKIQNRLGLVNEKHFSIHHARNSGRICPAAFIFDEDTRRMVNRWCANIGKMRHQWFLV